MFPGSQVIGTALVALFGYSLAENQSQILFIGPATGQVLLILAFVAGGIICTSFILTRFLKHLL